MVNAFKDKQKQDRLEALLNSAEALGSNNPTGAKYIGYVRARKALIAEYSKVAGVGEIVAERTLFR